jgi:hypothetical protein
VLLHTSFGDIDIELWPREAPKACRNFVQLVLEGVRCVDARQHLVVWVAAKRPWCVRGSTTTTPSFTASSRSSWYKAAIPRARALVRWLSARACVRVSERASERAQPSTVAVCRAQAARRCTASRLRMSFISASNSITGTRCALELGGRWLWLGERATGRACRAEAKWRWPTLGFRTPTAVSFSSPWTRARGWTASTPSLARCGCNGHAAALTRRS